MEIISSKPVTALYFQTQTLDSPAPTLLRQPKMVMNDTYAADQYLLVVLDAQIGTGATGTVYRAFIEPDASLAKPRFCSPFVAKLAWNDNDVRRLRHEYAIYRCLERNQVAGVPRLLGFYEAEDSNGMAALMITHVGRPLAKLMDKSKKLDIDDDKVYATIFRALIVLIICVVKVLVRYWMVYTQQASSIAIFERGT